MEIPAVFNFTSIPLKSSSSGSNLNKTQLLTIKDDITGELKELRDDIKSTKSDLKEVKRTFDLSRIINDAQNNALTQIKNKYSTFFDAESGNTTAQGLTQIMEELSDDLRGQNAQYKDLIMKHNKIVKKLEDLDASSSLLIFVTRPLHSFVYLASLRNYIATCISLLVPIFSLGLTILYVFTNLHIDTPYFIHSITDYIESLIKYEIFISLYLFI